ncbi:MAG: hypothetical protein VX549_00565 [Pseudomonadota bacterium]|nr:hypothetical protein [Pseudomonadota bacterium]
MPHCPFRNPLLAFAALGCLALAGCAGGQSGSESPVGTGQEPPATDAGLAGCVEASRSAIGREEPTALGFTAQDMLDLATGSQRATLDFAASTQEGDTTGLTVTVTDTGDAAEFVDAQPGESSPGAGCPDFIVVSVQLRLTSDDGRFDETLTAPLVAFQASEAGAIIDVDADALTGSYDYASADPETYASRVVIFNASFDGDGTTGRVSGTGTRTDGTEHTVTIAHWGQASAGGAR